MTHDLDPAKAGSSSMAAVGEDPTDRNAAPVLTSAYAGLDPATLTHDELNEVILQERGMRRDENAGNSFCSYVSTWCKSLGLAESDAARLSLGEGFDARLTAVTDNLAERSKSTAKNVRWAARSLKQTFESIRTNGSLALDFHQALKQSLQARGWEAKHLCAAMGWPKGHGSIYNYVSGKAAPRYPQSIALVMRIEKVLELPQNTLVSRAFRRPQLIRLGNHNPIKYRTHQSRRTKSTYALKELPQQFHDFWRELSDWRSQPKLRVNGVTYTPDSPLWARDGSQEKYNANLRRFMGWLTKPKPTKSLSTLTEEERWQAGKGIAEQKILLSHVFDIDLIWEFFDFLRARQHNQKYTQDHMHYAIFLNSLVNHDYAYVKAHPELAALFGKKPMSRPKWIAFTEDIHQKILQLCRDLRKASPKRDVKQRSADEPLQEIFDDADPTALFMQLVEDLIARIPPKNQKTTFAVHLRDIALFKLSIEQPLRAKNLSELEIGSSLIRDNETGLWRVLVPKESMKSHHSKHCHGVRFTLSEETSKAIDRYLAEGRPNLKNANQTRLFFVPGPSGPKPKPSKDGRVAPKYPGVTEEGIYWIVRRRTIEAFGVGQGPNVFRHLLATSILKDHPGYVELAAAKLDNSPDTIRDNYKHITRGDHLARAKNWFAEKQLKHAQTKNLKGRSG
jgi:hypothetical protein